TSRMRGPEGRDEDGQTPDSRREEDEGARPTEPDGPRTERSEGPKGRLSDGEATRPSLGINTDSAGQSALAPIRLGCRLARIGTSVASETDPAAAAGLPRTGCRRDHPLPCRRRDAPGATTRRRTTCAVEMTAGTSRWSTTARTAVARSEPAASRRRRARTRPSGAPTAVPGPATCPADSGPTRGTMMTY